MSESTSSPATRISGKYRARRPALILFGLISAVTLAVVLLPTVATWQIETQLEKLGARSVAVKHLSINPATGEISVEGFKSVGPDGEDIQVGMARLRISLSALTRRQITIQELTVADSDIDLRLDANGRWSVGGFPMDFASDKTEPPSEDDPWDLKANDISVTNSRMTLAIGKTPRSGTVNNLQIDTLSTLRPDAPATMSLAAETAGGTIRLTGKIFPFAKKPSAEISADIAGIELQTLTPLIADGRIKNLGGKASVKGTLTAVLAENESASVDYTGSVTLLGGIANTTFFETAAKKFEWTGKANIRLPAATESSSPIPGMAATGTVAIDDFSYKNRITGLSLKGKSASLAFRDTGLNIRPDTATPGGTKIAANAEFLLTEADLDQPDTGLRIVPGKLRITSKLDLNLPPGTAAFDGRFSTQIEIDRFKAGGMPEIETVSAGKLQLSYDKAALKVGPKGNIDLSGSLKFTLSETKIGSSGKTVNAALDSLRTTGQEFTFARTPDGKMETSADGDLTANGIRIGGPDGAWILTQKLWSWSGGVKTGTDTDRNLVWSVNGKLQNDDISVQLPDGAVSARVARGEWTGKASGSDDPENLLLDGEAVISKIAVILGGKGKEPYTISARNGVLKGMSVKGARQKISSVTIAQLAASGASEDSDLPEIAVANVFVSGIDTPNSGRTTIDKVRITGLDGVVTRSAAGSVAMPVTGTPENSPAPKTQTAATTGGAAATSPSTLRIGEANLTDAKLTFKDIAADPPFSIETSQLQASLKNLDTEKGADDTDVNIRVGLGKFGRIQTTGKIKPLPDAFSADLEIGFENIELFKFNPYIIPAIQHTIRQGRADGNIDLKLRDDKLNAKTTLRISRLKVVQTPSSKKGGSAPPIETALGLLENKNGIVKLSIPISGSVDDPKFDLSDAIGQAVAGAMRETLLTAVKIAFPLGTVVAIIDSVGNPKFRIQPIAFAPGSAALTPAINSRVAEIAEYLTKKPKETPSICGPATAADLAALRKSNPKAEPGDALKLAERRITSVRDRLVSAHSIPVSRLFVCAPEMSAKPDAVPVVDVDLKG